MTRHGYAGAETLGPVVDAFTSVAWPLTTERCAHIAAHLNWSVSESLASGTDFSAQWSGDYPSIATLSEAEHTTEVLVRATHPLHHWEESDLADAFQSIVVGLMSILGDPHQLSESGACWEARTGGRIWVKRLSTAASIILLVLSPEYAETERLEELALAG